MPNLRGELVLALFFRGTGMGFRALGLEVEVYGIGACSLPGYCNVHWARRC